MAPRGRGTHTLTLSPPPLTQVFTACWLQVSDGSATFPSPSAQTTLPSLPTLGTAEELALWKLPPP